MTPEQQIAQRAFPAYRITGSGTIAVRKDCCEEVELCESSTAAQLIKSIQCCRYCSMRHFIQYRKPPKQPVVITNTGYRE